ncbi:hypothetical protein HMPREF3227_01550 [Corynebacterium sp. CMW7794]|nr:hypothetical protein HMPREF0307_00314 [Corynebacterium sp. DNF00584]KXI17524.1 hypothetical protein HMPREF3227_01550 [Corynebacterium sp. CMW7794]
MSATSSTESAREERDAEDVVVALEEDGSKDSDAEDVAEVDAEVVAAGDEVLDADVEVTVGDAGAAGAGVSGGVSAVSSEPQPTRRAGMSATVARRASEWAAETWRTRAS